MTYERTLRNLSSAGGRKGAVTHVTIRGAECHHFGGLGEVLPVTPSGAAAHAGVPFKFTEALLLFPVSFVPFGLASGAG
jgi:hypothetical protein